MTATIKNQSLACQGADVHKTTKPQRWVARLTVVAMAIQALSPMAAVAQVTPAFDSMNQKALKSAAANGTTILNITSPTAKGVSRNLFTEFSVDAKGLVFNNSATAVSSQLTGGTIQGNTSLSMGTAKVILSEVVAAGATAPALTKLDGRLEVVGSKAEVIIANPTGITCNGCGFINTSRASLVAGGVTMDQGAVKSLNVTGGTLTVGNVNAAGVALGLAGFNTVINGTVSADSVASVTGANQIDYATLANTLITPSGTAAPSLSIQSIGNVQAGQIYLVSSGTAMVDGSIKSTAGSIVVRADGGISISGNPDTSKIVNVTATGGSVELTSGSHYYQRHASVSSDGGDVIVNAASHVDAQSNASMSGRDVFINVSQSNSIYRETIHWLPFTIKATRDINVNMKSGTKSSAVQIRGGDITAGRDIQIFGESVHINDMFWAYAYAIYGIHDERPLSIKAGRDFSVASTTGRLTLGSTSSQYHQEPMVTLTAGQDMFISSGSTSAATTPFATLEFFPIDIKATGSILINSAGSLRIKPKTNIEAANLTILANGPTDLNDLKARTSQDIYITGKADPTNGLKDIITSGSYTAGGDITVVSPTELGFTTSPITSTFQQSSGTSCGGGSVVWRSICLGAAENSTITETINLPTVLTAKGNVVLQSSGGFVNLDGTMIRADGSVVVAGQGIGLFGPIGTKVTNTTQANTTTILMEETSNAGSILAKGDISLLAAGNVNGLTDLERNGDIFTTGATIQSEDGHVAMNASRDVTVANDLVSTTLYESYYKKKRGLFYSKTEQRITNSVDETVVPSVIGGQTLSIGAGRDVEVTASDIQATGSIGIHADRDLSLFPAEEADSLSTFHQIKKSGIFGKDSFGISIGTSKVTDVSNMTSVQQTGSSVSSIMGDIQLSAGNQYLQNSSELMAFMGDISINAKEVGLRTTNNTYTVMNSIRQVESGLSLSIGHPLITATQTAIDMRKASKRADNGHTKTLAALTTALSAYGAYRDLSKDVDSATVYKPSGTDSGTTAANDAFKQFADTRISLTATLGYSSSEFKNLYQTITPSEVSIMAGGNVSISATGQHSNEQGNITIIGAKVSAGQGLTLRANTDVNIMAAKGLLNESSTTKASAKSIGLTLNAQGLAANMAFSNTRGFTNGRGTEYVHSVLSAGPADASGRLEIETGRDILLNGGSLNGHTVYMTTGLSGFGNLTVASVQDSQFYTGKEVRWGVTVSVPIPGLSLPTAATTLGLTYDQFKLLMNYQSAKEQTAIRAGAGGFDIYVSGDTLLKGGVLSSTSDANFSVLATDTLKLENLKNFSKVEGSSESASLQFSTATNAQGGTTANYGGSSYGFATIDRSSMGDTKAAISAIADVKINYLNEPGFPVSSAQYMKLYGPTRLSEPANPTPPPTMYDAPLKAATDSLAQYSAAKAACTTNACRDAAQIEIDRYQKQVTRNTEARWVRLTQDYLASGINRDVNSAHKPVAPELANMAQVSRQLKTDAAVMNAFVKAGYKAAGDFAQDQIDKATALRKEATGMKAGSPEEIAKLTEAGNLEATWGKSGIGRFALHTLVGGVALGTAGALASGGTVAVSNVVNNALAKLPDNIKNNPALFNAIQLVSVTIIGAAIGGGNGAVAAFNADANNRQLHEPERGWTKSNAKKYKDWLQITKSESISTEEAYQRLLSAGYAIVDTAASRDGRSFESAKQFIALYAPQNLFLATAAERNNPFMSGHLDGSYTPEQQARYGTPAPAKKASSYITKALEISNCGGDAALCSTKYESIFNAINLLNEAKILYQDDAASLSIIEEQVIQLKGSITPNELISGASYSLASKYKDAIADLILGIPRGLTKALNKTMLTSFNERIILVGAIKEGRAMLTSKAKNSGNVAAGLLTIDGQSKILLASSKVDVATGNFVGTGSESFKSLIINGLDAKADSEYKIFDNIADMLGGSSTKAGRLTIVTERPPCNSCQNAWGEFEKRFPNFEVQIFNNDAIGLTPKGTTIFKGSSLLNEN